LFCRSLIRPWPQSQVSTERRQMAADLGGSAFVAFATFGPNIWKRNRKTIWFRVAFKTGRIMRAIGEGKAEAVRSLRHRRSWWLE